MHSTFIGVLLQRRVRKWGSSSMDTEGREKVVLIVLFYFILFIYM